VNACRAAYDAAVVVRAVAGLVAFCALVGGAAGAAAPTLAISATGYLGFPDTVVIAVSNPSSRLEIHIPDGYGFPQRDDSGGHAVVRFADGSGERGRVSVLATHPPNTCASGEATRVWDMGFTRARVFVFLAPGVMTICPLPSETTHIMLASKYWSTPGTAGAYLWRATTADGARAAATVRLPVVLTLAQIARRPRVRVRARLTEDGAPISGKLVVLSTGSQRLLAQTRTRADGTALFALGIRRKVAALATVMIGEQADEPHSVRSARVTLRP
jgi:hypothetical protein